MSSRAPLLAVAIASIASMVSSLIGIADVLPEGSGVALDSVGDGAVTVGVVMAGVAVHAVIVKQAAASAMPALRILTMFPFVDWSKSKHPRNGTRHSEETIGETPDWGRITGFR